MTLILKPSDTKRAAAVKWIVRSILLAVLFVGSELFLANQWRHPIEPARLGFSLGMAVAMPWMAKRPLTLHILVLFVWMGFAVSAYAIVHLLALVLHMTHSTRAWETAAIAALLMAPSVVIAARWQLRIDQEDAQRAAFITKV